MSDVLTYRARTLARNAVWSAHDLLSRPTASWRALPDYLIVGAQRSGTTSLQSLLASHPAVRPPFLRKGIHYFDTGFDRGRAWYRSQFPYRRRRRRLTGEASPYYLFHPLAPERIADLVPNVKVIALLRDPIERAISHYKHEVRRGFETLDMTAAFEAEEERLSGEEERMLNDGSYLSFAHQHHSYIARGRYSEQLDRYAKLLPSENILLIESESFWRDPQPVVRDTLTFLGLDEGAPPELPRLNATTGSPVASELRRRLDGEFADSNHRLATEWGIGATWR